MNVDSCYPIRHTWLLRAGAESVPSGTLSRVTGYRRSGPWFILARSHEVSRARGPKGQTPQGKGANWAISSPLSLLGKGAGMRVQLNSGSSTSNLYSATSRPRTTKKRRQGADSAQSSEQL
jgi:hypothetical protein